MTVQIYFRGPPTDDLAYKTYNADNLEMRCH